jgi:hypothetical protein
VLKECKGIPPSEAMNMTYAQVCFAMKGIDSPTIRQEISRRNRILMDEKQYRHDVALYIAASKVGSDVVYEVLSGSESIPTS